MMLLTKQTGVTRQYEQKRIAQSSTKGHVGLQQDLIVVEPFKVKAKQKTFNHNKERI